MFENLGVETQSCTARETVHETLLTYISDDEIPLASSTANDLSLEHFRISSWGEVSQEGQNSRFPGGDVLPCYLYHFG